MRLITILLLLLTTAYFIQGFNWPKCEHVFTSVEQPLVKIERVQFSCGLPMGWNGGIHDGKDLICVKCFLVQKQRLDYGKPWTNEIRNWSWSVDPDSGINRNETPRSTSARIQWSKDDSFVSDTLIIDTCKAAWWVIPAGDTTFKLKYGWNKIGNLEFYWDGPIDEDRDTAAAHWSWSIEPPAKHKRESKKQRNSLK